VAHPSHGSADSKMIGASLFMQCRLWCHVFWLSAGSIAIRAHARCRPSDARDATGCAQEHKIMTIAGESARAQQTRRLRNAGECHWSLHRLGGAASKHL
jgi:hypothetical protein